MCPADLERLISEDKARGLHPFFVNCTAGTTVIGAFDPINDIADICERHGVWMHIDVIVNYFISVTKLPVFKGGLGRRLADEPEPQTGQV